MKKQEIKDEICKNIEENSKVWIFIRNGDKIFRCNIGFETLELLGMASLATHEICQLMGGDKSLAPVPIERRAEGFDKEVQKCL